MKAHITALVTLIITAALLCSCSEYKANLTEPNNANSSETYANIYTDLEISELMPANRSFYMANSGGFYDWFELHNYGKSAVNLEDYCVSDNENEPLKYHLPATTLNPDDYIVILASGLDKVADGEIHTNFKLSKDGETLTLSHSSGEIISTKTYSSASSDISYLSDNTTTQYATPGFENTDAGYISYCESLPASSLCINEVMPMNDTYLEYNGKHYDWLELKNNSSAAINLSGYYLTDNKDELTKYQLPNKVLNAGELFTILCSNDITSTDSILSTGFSINGTSDAVYLTNGAAVCDAIPLVRIPYGVSVGKQQTSLGMFYFTTPSPGAENTNGIRMIAATPKTSVAQGVFNNSQPFTVELLGEGTIHYTLDGSKPTKDSPVYQSPITVNSTTVVRAISVVSGKLTSHIANASYIYNAGHSLPVLSLMVNNDDLFDAETGIYVKGNHDNYYMDWEKEASLTLFENNETVFSTGCGLKMFGSGSRADCDKKSLRANFKSRYGSNKVSADLFSNGVTKYTSLVMRGGEDAGHTVFRNEVFTTLAQDCMPNLLVQSNKFCVMYVNGEYWGVFCLCEHYSETYFAEHMNVSKSSVTFHEAPFDTHTPMYRFLEYTQTHDMSQSENYKYIDENINLDSMIDFFIMQAYSRNRDISGNIRYFYSTETGKWQYAYYDLDWAFYKRGGQFDILTNGEQYSIIINNLFKNAEFKDRFCKRLAYLLSTTLSNENVLSVIDGFYNALKSEMPADRKRWPAEDKWENCVTRMKEYVTTQNLAKELVLSLKENISLSDSEIKAYFSQFVD